MRQFFAPWKSGGARWHDYGFFIAIGLLALALISNVVTGAFEYQHGKYVQRASDAQWIKAHPVLANYVAPAETKAVPLMASAPTVIPNHIYTINFAYWRVGGNNQSIVGSCVSWSYSKALAQGFNALTHRRIFPSPRYHYSVATGGNDFGSNIRQYPPITNSVGIVLSKDYPYGTAIDRLTQYAAYHLLPYADDAVVPPNAADNAIKGYTVSLNFLFTDAGAGEGGIERIEQSILSGVPVTLAFPVYPEFDNARYGSPYIGLPGPNEQSRGGHENTIVGFYVDSNGQVWLLDSNQWGPLWGGLNEYGQPSINGDYAWDSGAFIGQYAWDAATVEVARS